MTPPTLSAALAAYERAEQSHKRADWKQAARLLAQAVALEREPVAKAVKRAAPALKPAATLCEFLAITGIRDDGGELAGMDAGKWHMQGGWRKAKRRAWGSPGDVGGMVDAWANVARRGPDGRLVGSLIRPDGRSLEAAAEAAWLAGYFPDVPMPGPDDPESYHPVTGEMLLAAIRREIWSKPLTDEDRFGSAPDMTDSDVDEEWIQNWERVA